MPTIVRASTGLLVLALLVSGCEGSDRRLAPIHLDSMLTIGAASGDGVMTTQPRVSAPLADGTRILVPQPGGASGMPAVFGGDGRYLGAIGIEGDSMGELRGATFARVAPRDSIYLFAENNRAIVFGPDRSPVRTIPLPVTAWDAVVLADGRIAITSALSEKPLPFRLLFPDGRVSREMGQSDSGSLAVHSPRWIASGNDGSFWTMPQQFVWRLEHWDSTGQLIAAIERDPRWFPRYRQVLTVGKGQAPQPMVQGFWLDRAGRLWVLGRTADPAWRHGLEPEGGGSSSLAIVDADKVYDTVLELRDPMTGALIAQTRYDVSYPFVVEPGVVARVLATHEGWKVAQLMRVVLDSVTSIKQ